ncbi:hypothetical protein B6U71_02500 [Euryarchaeota archaeon ex4484_178]|nr:MAG: hypothetical protein B6U71_02500 [Euryarchaeota archaeon ex4484_178]
MKIERQWLFLIIYYILLPIPSLNSLSSLFATLGTIGVSILILFFYKIIKDEILFYLYNFIGILGLIFTLSSYNPYSPLTLLIAYGLLSLILLHINYTHRVWVCRNGGNINNDNPLSLFSDEII